ncbi:tRNA lysidine(34) synthetase TilS, partial [Glaesserella parasuis]|nr:tRNA lysidine(34) synthetase TilS [Glaesserella parasuis]MWQ57785.1 tRNA lysidine(34) synthetase TilS [Glaesserella parasuis]
MKKLWQQHNVPYWLRQRTPLIFYGDQLQCVDTIRHNKFYFINVSKLNAVCFCKTA